MTNPQALRVGRSPGAIADARRWPFWLSVLLVTYGSLYPLRFSHPGDLDAAIRAFVSDQTLWSSPGDVGGNIVLFLPLGVFAWRLRIAPGRGGWRVGLVCLGCVLFAIALQAFQMFFPPRVPALGDAAWNSFGICVGALARGIAIRSGWTSDGGHPAQTWPLALVTLWVLTQLAPWIPALDWQLVKDGLKPLLLAPELNVPKLFGSLTKVIAVGLLVAAIKPASPASIRSFGMLLVAVLVGKLLIADQGWTPANVGGFCGGFVAWLMLIKREKASSYTFALFALVTSYTIAALTPFELRSAPSVFDWIPLGSMLDGAMDTNAWALLDMLFVFGAVLWFAKAAGASVGGLAMALCIWVTCVEIAQGWVVGRTSEITPPLLVLVLGYAVRNSSR